MSNNQAVKPDGSSLRQNAGGFCDRIGKNKSDFFLESGFKVVFDGIQELGSVADIA